MADGDRVPDEGVVIRRFDPTDERHWSLDETTGELRLRSYAFGFDDEPGYGGKGCSVFLEAMLVDLGHDCWAVIEEERDHWAVAAAAAGTVRSVTRANLDPPSTPFDVVEAPDTEEVPGVAHALVTHSLPLPGSSAWYRALSQVFEVRLPASA